MDIFLREKMLLGDEAMEKIYNSHVIVFGLGGVGSWAAEALVRSGIGEITLVDHDTISVSNINRQLCALHSTVGMFKTEALAARLSDINPSLKINILTKAYLPENRDEFWCTHYDYIVDAIDTVTSKLDLIEVASKKSIPIISAMGTGNKLDATQLTVCDISKTYNCPLAKVMRKELRTRGILHHKVVFSPEEKVEAEQLEAPPEGRRSVPGSTVWVPATAGLIMASEAIKDIIKPR